MRRPAALAAATAVTVISIGLISPAAQAVTSPASLVGTASCVDGGRIRLAAGIGADGTATALAKVSGVTAKRWVGEVVAGIDSTLGMSPEGAAAATTTYTARHGAFSAVSTRANATTLDAVGYFLGVGSGARSSAAECGAMVVSQGHTYVVANVLGKVGLAVVTGRPAAVDASIDAQRHHRYRASFTVTGKGAPQHFSSVKTATKRGVLDIVVRHVKRLSSFSKVSVKVTDLSAPKSDSLTYSIGR